MTFLDTVAGDGRDVSETGKPGKAYCNKCLLCMHIEHPNTDIPSNILMTIDNSNIIAQ